MAVTKAASRVQVLRPDQRPARRTIQPPLADHHRTRVAAYCRVSTDHEDQETSFEAQQTHFTNFINGNPEWEMVGIYADEESGVRANKRENFMRMIGDCESGKIDMVLSKSISRWARNTLDSLKYIRKLKALEIPVFFTKENINTMDAGGEVLTTILSSLAQQESASISQNVQIGVRYHYQEGKVCSGVHRLLGYNRTPEGSLVIVPEEAEIVQRIFRDFLDGYSTKHIAKRLAEEGVDGNKTTVGGTVFERNWNYHGIEYILKNEKYSGDLLLQKYYTVDFLTKKVAKNNGQLPQYFVENSHEAIIPKEVFQQAQAERERRRRHWKDFKYTHAVPLSGKVICGCCGLPYRPVKSTWRCDAKMNKDRHPDIVCDNDSIRDETLRQAVVDAMNMLPERAEELIRLEERLRWGGLQKADDLLTQIETAMDALDEEIREAKERADTTAEQEAREQLNDLRGHWAEASEQRAVYADKMLQIRNLRDRVKAITEGSEERPYRKSPNGRCEDPDLFFRLTRPDYPDGKVVECRDDDILRLVEKIEIGETKVTVTFKAGISIELERGA
ncbi:MAG: recombinase family protein [Oscillospiraceae bacterium]|nr:recombinase family protein [Oscillospiraceae bacterium]